MTASADTALAPLATPTADSPRPLGPLGRGSLWLSPAGNARTAPADGQARAPATMAWHLALHWAWPTGFDAARRSAIRAQVQATQTWRHAHLLPVHRLADVGNAVQLVHAAPTGALLSDWLSRRGLPDVETAMRWARGLTAALVEGKRLGFAHGGAHPSAVWIGDDGRAHWLGAGLAPWLLDAPVLVDPGLASARDARQVAHWLIDWLHNAGVAAAEQAPLRELVADDGAASASALGRLSDWLNARAGDAGDPAPPDWPGSRGARSERGQARLVELMQGLRDRSDFPALSERVTRIQRLAQSDAEPLQRLADEILHDVSLTQRLLRVVNAASARRSETSVATVSRAVALVGVAGVRNLALSLILMEHLKDGDDRRRLRAGYARALLAGEVAQRLCPLQADAEAAHLGAVFYNLGPLLAAYHFPQEAAEVDRRLALAAQAGPVSDAVVDRISADVLGLGYWDLGLAIAQHWGLPDDLQTAMQRPSDDPQPTAAAHPERRPLWMARLSNAVADCLWAGPADTWGGPLRTLGQQHARVLGLRPETVRAAAEGAWDSLLEMADAVGLSDALPSPGPGADPPDAPAADRRAAAPGSHSAAGQAAAPPAPAAAAADPAPAVAAARGPVGLAALSAAVQELSVAMVSEAPALQQVLSMVMEGIYRGLNCRQVVLALRDASGARLNGRLALGGNEQLSAVARAQPLQVVLAESDALAKACVSGQELWIDQVEGCGERWPTWLQETYRPAAFVALPLRLRGQPVALIYADFSQPAAWGDTERALVGVLRSQALLAMKPAGT